MFYSAIIFIHNSTVFKWFDLGHLPIEDKVSTLVCPGPLGNGIADDPAREGDVLLPGYTHCAPDRPNACGNCVEKGGMKRRGWAGSCLKRGQHFIFYNYIFIIAYIINIFFIPYQRYCLKLLVAMYKSERFYLIMILIMEIIGP